MLRTIKSIVGVTLLEIMLVLAIAAMVIIMSVRYYQSSTTSQQANSVMQSIQAIQAAVDNIAQGGGGTYSAVTSTILTSVMGSAAMKTPTNQPIVFTATGESTYTISMPLNEAVCTSVSAKLAANPKFSGVGCTSGTLAYTYDSTAG